MRSYQEIIAQGGTSWEDRYHEWTVDSIERYWRVCTRNPFIQRQFYPVAYWQDFLIWARGRMRNEPTIIADIGCGVGHVIQTIRRLYDQAEIVGVDLSDDSLSEARRRLSHDLRIDFKVGSLDKLPFDDAQLDIVTCTEVLEHTFPQTFENAFAEVSRVLRPGGYFLASVPFDETVIFVTCPECQSIFTPYQHMLFEISHGDVKERLSKDGLRLVDFYISIDRTQPKSFLKRSMKSILIGYMPKLAKRLFPSAGVSGFLAERIS